MRNQLLSTAQKSSAPDIAFISPEWLPELVRLDILSPIENIDGYDNITSQILSNTIDSGRRGEHIYGLPFSLNTNILLYNPELFEQANIEVPTSTSTLFEAVEAIGGLGSDISGLALNGLDSSSLTPYIWGNGGALLNAEQNKAKGQIDSSKNVAFMEQVVELYNEGALLNASENDANIVELFAAGKIGMVMADTEFIAKLEQEYPEFVYEVLTDNGCYNSILLTTLVVIPNDEKMELAWNFFKELTNEQTQNLYAGCGIIPANKMAMESTNAKTAAYAPYIPILESAQPLPNVSEWTEMDNEFAVAMSQITGGYKTVEESFDDLAKKWEGLWP